LTRETMPGTALQYHVGFIQRKKAALPPIFVGALMISKILFQSTAPHPQHPVDADRIEFVRKGVSMRATEFADTLYVLHCQELVFHGHRDLLKNCSRFVFAHREIPPRTLWMLRVTLLCHLRRMIK
jgi:hypothetical protein